MAEPGAITYRFEDFELDSARFELRQAGAPIHCEPQVLALLMHLCANSDRLIDKDEIIEKIWDGRIVSESAIAARVKSARKAIGDDGTAQRLIKTIHGKGFRFVGQVDFDTPARVLAGDAATGEPIEAEHDASGDRRPSIAVLPFRRIGALGDLEFIADALPDELIMDLARLRWLFVIARGSTFRFRDREGAGAALGVRYTLSGSIERQGSEIVVNVELAGNRGGEVLWAQSYRAGAQEAQQWRSEIARQVAANVELRIAQSETQVARTLPSASLDSWSAFHLGLDHMYRFNRADTDRASSYFKAALAADPHFARAYGGLSFTSFQRAFMRFGDDRATLVGEARKYAQKALDLDRLDPFSHFNMGRSYWLEGALDQSRACLGQAIELCPNFAQGIYVKGLATTLAGEPDPGDEDVRLAMSLSPLDPLRYAMIGTRSFSSALRGDFERAARLGVEAAYSPGAHKHIDIIAAIGTHLAGQDEAAKGWVARARERDPTVSAADFLRAFPFAQNGGRELIERALVELGL